MGQVALVSQWGQLSPQDLAHQESLQDQGGLGDLRCLSALENQWGQADLFLQGSLASLGDHPSLGGQQDRGPPWSLPSQ